MKDKIHINRITNNFLYSFLLHIVLKDTKTLEAVKINNILHSHEAWLSLFAYLLHSAETILGQGEMWGDCLIDKFAADTVTQKIPSSQQAGSNGEKRCCKFFSKKTWTTQRKVHPNLQKQFSCDTVHSLVSSCNMWETHHPKAMP